MGNIGKILICLFVSILETACVRSKNVEMIEECVAIDAGSMPTLTISTQKETNSKEDETMIFSKETESVSEISNYPDNINMEIKVSDILIPENIYLDEIPFMIVNIEHILEYNPELEKIEGQEGMNGHYNYWKDSGIEYVTYSSEKNLIGIILYNGNYSLANGIRVGMAETELLQMGYPFEKCEDETSSGLGAIVFGSSLLRDGKGPFKTIDYDYVYAYVGNVSENEAHDYDISEMTCYSIVLLIKDGVVNEIILDLPTAG